MLRNALVVSLILLSAQGIAAQSPSTSKARPAVRPVKAVWPDEEGPLKWAPRPTSAAISPDDLRTRLYQLADDSMMGRRIGELGNYKGTTYIAREFKRMGLKPGGDNGTWFQELPFGPLGFDSLTSHVAVGSSALVAKRDWVPVAPTATNGIRADVDLHGVPTVFGGRWGDTSVALDPTKFTGRIAVFVVPATAAITRAQRDNSGDKCDPNAGFPNQRGASDALDAAAAAQASRGAAPAARGSGGRGNAPAGPGSDLRAVTAGAVGIILVQDSLPTAAATATFNGRMMMQPTVAVPGASGVAVMAMANAAASKIFARSLDGLAVATPGAPLSATWSYQWRMSKTPGRNVIAILPGSDPALAGEYVLLSAHNDHVGTIAVAVDHDSLRAYNRIMRPQGANDQPVCPPSALQQHLIDSMIAHARSIRPPRRDSIMNGAEDDGSGTVVMMEVAEKFASEKVAPKRSLIFVSHTGEEAGLLGSAWFTAHPTIPLDSVVAANNMDMESRGRVTDVKFGGPNSIQSLGSRRLSRAFGDIVDSVNARSPEPMVIDKTWDVFANPLNRFCRSDQVSYVHHNVPVTYYSTGYYEDYHQATDEPQYIDFNKGARIANFMHGIMTAIANRHDKPFVDGPDTNYPACR